MEKINVVGLLPGDLVPFVDTWGEPVYRAKQITGWVYQHKISDWSQMKNLPQFLQQELSRQFDLGQGTITGKRVSRDGTTKYLFQLADGKEVEIVMIPHRKRVTLCLSTQVGCPVACAFCATGQAEFIRNLTYQEIVESAWAAEKESGLEINNIVFMGMGEPLLNYDHLVKAIGVLNAEDGFRIGSRHITVSTVGIPDKIVRLAEDWPQITLAVSLHAPKNELRKQLVPINDVYPISLVMKAVEQYITITNRRVTIEYSLWTDVNDQREYAYQLAALLRGILVHVNLIPGNPVGQAVFIPSSPARAMTFARILEDQRIHVTIRESHGQDIEAACGELYGLHRKRGGIG